MAYVVSSLLHVLFHALIEDGRYGLFRTGHVVHRAADYDDPVGIGRHHVIGPENISHDSLLATARERRSLNGGFKTNSSTRRESYPDTTILVSVSSLIFLIIFPSFPMTLPQ